ncbi:MAG TPA: hypothetical protein DDY82_05580 [Clostridiales bacterium]|nr:hypothetical protein [Clostridiales bacterium]HBJ98506.1 hypothetical protein [Clostridiales bacterium]
MQKTIGKVLYDTENAKEIKRVSHSYFGDPAGYEEVLYQTEKGHYFIYGVGGAESKYPAETIKTISKAKVQAWIDEN